MNKQTTREITVERAKALGRRLDKSEGHKLYQIRRYSSSIELEIDGTTVAEWNKQENGLFEQVSGTPWEAAL